MQVRGIAWMLCAALLGVCVWAGCGDDGAPSGSANNGAADAGNNNQSDAGDDTDAEAPFNYIPLNDEACAIEEESEGAVASADQRVSALLKSGPSSIGEGFEVCSETPLNGCPACSDTTNRLNALLVALDAPLISYLGELAEASPLTSLQEYFFEALRYPLRHLSVTVSACADLERGSCPRGTTHRVTLTQSKKQPCAEGFSRCDHYSVEPESLDLSCSAFPLQFYGAVEEQGDGTRRLRATLPDEALDDVTFGFIVPVIESLPPNPETLTDAELEAWLEELATFENRLDVRVSQPSLELNLDASLDRGCGKMTGYVPSTLLTNIVEGEDPAVADLVRDTILPQYVDSEDPTRIAAELSFEVVPGTFTSGLACKPNPCGEERGTCNGDVLEYTIPTTACTLDRPASFVNGDSIAPQCGAPASVQGTVDCAELGGTCARGACTSEWESPAKGEVVVSELFYGVTTLDDGAEPGFYTWVELTNVSDSPLQLNDCVARSRSGGTFGNLQTLTSDAPLIIAPGGRFVMGGSMDASLNGGIEPDYPFGENLFIDLPVNNAFSLTCDDVEIDIVTWEYEVWGSTRDVAWQLQPSALDATANDDPANWCPATAPFGSRATSLGTPGEANAPCP